MRAESGDRSPRGCCGASCTTAPMTDRLRDLPRSHRAIRRAGRDRRAQSRPCGASRRRIGRPAQLGRADRGRRAATCSTDPSGVPLFLDARQRRCSAVREVGPLAAAGRPRSVHAVMTPPLALGLAAIVAGSSSAAFSTSASIGSRAASRCHILPSRCPRCANGCAWFDNIPVLSWLVLRGKCRQCRAPISLQYPIVEVVTALVAVLVVYFTPPGPLLASRLMLGGDPDRPVRDRSRAPDPAQCRHASGHCRWSGLQFLRPARRGQP